jgi:hypothetical protein
MKTILIIVSLLAFACPQLQAAEAARVLIVVGPSNHPPGTHEVAAGGRLLKYCVESMANVPDVKAELVYEWPGQALRNAASTIVFIGDMFPPNRLPDVKRNLAEVDEMMKRGCGIVCIHYATGLSAEDVEEGGDHPLLRWMGGYFATRCKHHLSVARVFSAATITPKATHPINQGWKEFTLPEEPYINNYFGRDGNRLAPNVIALATSMLPPEAPKPEIVAWCVNREDGGRGFGIVMPHFYTNWIHEDVRRFILNGIVWTAKLEVPAEGVITPVPALADFKPVQVQPTNSPAKPSAGNVTPSALGVPGTEYKHPIRYEIWAPKEVKGSTNEDYRLWIPDKVRTVRAVIIVPDYSTDKAVYFSEELGYRQFAERMGFALMAYRVFNEDSDKTRDEATKDMLSALESIAKHSGHPELAHASLLPTGLSWGGRCAMAIALSAPERTIGFVPLHCTLTFKEISESAHKDAFFKVPGLCETVEFEQYYDKTRPPFEATDTGLAVRACNALGALHASYIFPGSKHNDVKNHEFIWEWITFITEKRLPSPLTFDKSPELKPMLRESGWIGAYDYDHSWDTKGKLEHFKLKSATIAPYADFKGDPATANWLPNEELAKSWKAKMGF